MKLRCAPQCGSAVLIGTFYTHPHPCLLPVVSLSFLLLPNPNIRSERRKEELYAFSEEELRPYFALPEVCIVPYPFFVSFRLPADEDIVLS